MIDDLASLIAPVSEAEFVRHFLAKERLLIKAADPERAASLFPWATINAMIASDVVPSDFISVRQARTTIPSRLFRREIGRHRLRANALQALASPGFSIFINNIDNFVPQIGRLNDAIERRMGHKISINTYMSFGNDSAFKLHYDTHDVIVLQVHGRKRWRGYGTPKPFPMTPYQSASNSEKIEWSEVLEPGDVLYLPSGELHDATVEDGQSVHLTIGMKPCRGVDLVSRLTETASNDVSFRMELTRLAGEEGLKRHEAHLKEKLHALVDAISVTALLDADDRQRVPRAAVNFGTLDPIAPETMIVPAVRRAPPVPREGNEETVLDIGGEKFRLKPAAHRVLSLLLSRNKLTLGEVAADLPAMSQSDLQDAVSNLAKLGLVGLLGPGEV